MIIEHAAKISVSTNTTATDVANALENIPVTAKLTVESFSRDRGYGTDYTLVFRWSETV